MSISTDAGLDQRYIQCEGNVWRLALTASGDRLIYATGDGRIVAMDLSTRRTLWRHELGAFAFALACRDIDEDGREELLIADAAGRLVILDENGTCRWTYHAEQPLYNAAAGRLQPTGPICLVTGGAGRELVVLSAKGQRIASHSSRINVHRVALGDLDGDGADEILLINARDEASALKLRGNRLDTLWSRKLTVPAEMRNWENPSAHFFAFSVEIGDVLGDAKATILMGDSYFNKQAVMLADATGSGVWISDRLASGEPFYSTAFVRMLSVPGQLQKQVIAVAAGTFRLFDAHGKPLGIAESPVGFTDVVTHGQVAYLGSTPGADNFVYRIDLAGDWQQQLRTLRRAGKLAQIGHNLAHLRAQAIAATTQRDSVEKLIIKMGSVNRTTQGPQHAHQSISELKNHFPYSNLEQVMTAKVIESTAPLDEQGNPWNPGRWSVDAINGTMGVDEIVAFAERIEQQRVPTMFLIGHSCMPFITLDTAEKMLRAAPEFLRGFISAEDEDVEQFPRYARHFFGPLADLCVRYGGRKCVTVNKNVWWMSVPSLREAFDELFAGRRREVLVAATEDSNSRTPELNLMARFGLRQAGLINHMQASAIGDLFSFCRFHQWEYPRSGHPYLRVLVANAVLGCNIFHPRVGAPITRDGTLVPDPIAQESGEIMLHLLGKGLVVIPRPDQIMHISPVGIAIHQPPQEWLIDGHNGHRPHAWPGGDALNHAVMPHNGCNWGMSPTPEHALQYVLLHKRRQFGYHVPPTPYGAIAIVPAHADLARVVGVSEWWHTDGVAIWRESGPRMTGMLAADALRETFGRAASRMPFGLRGDNVFFQAIRLRDGRFRLYFIDPGWLDPAERRANIEIRLPGRMQATDALSGEPVPTNGSAMEILVPAGALRIIDVVKLA